MASASWAVAAAWRQIATATTLPWWTVAAIESAAAAFEAQAREYEARKGTTNMTENKTAKPGPTTTLTQAREELAGVRPGRDASLTAWLAYYQRAATLYADLAESDREHYHECLY